MTIDLDSGPGGASAQREYERRIARRDAAIEETWGNGRLGRFVKTVGPVPQSTEAWAKGADGARRLAAALERRTSEDAVLLHDRAVTGRKGNIDHIAIASTGVWVIGAKNYGGRIERRDLGTWRTTDDRLYVGGRDRTKLVARTSWSANVVRSVIEPLGIDVDVHRVLCFTDADWGWLAKPFKVDGVIITYPSALASAVSAGGLLMTEHVRTLAAELNRALPPV